MLFTAASRAVTSVDKLLPLSASANPDIVASRTGHDDAHLNSSQSSYTCPIPLTHYRRLTVQERKSRQTRRWTHTHFATQDKPMEHRTSVQRALCVECAQCIALLSQILAQIDHEKICHPREKAYDISQAMSTAERSARNGACRSFFCFPTLS